MANDIVGAHGHQVLADRVVAIQSACDLGLGSYAVGRSHDQGPPQSVRHLRHRAELADQTVAEITAAGFDKICFAWAGGFEPGGHDADYWRAQLPGELAWLAS